MATGFLARFDWYHEQASKATGFHDFGGSDYHQPLRLLLSDYDRYMRFNAVGTEMIDSDIVGRLVGRLMTEHGVTQHPASYDAPIEKPLVIIGMARTGTTALFRLLSQDPALQSLPMWLACAPMPRPPRDTWKGNPFYRQVEEGLEQVYALSPDIRSVHPMAAGEPDECRFAMDHAFWSPDCLSTATIPNYTDWAINGDARYAYQYHRRVLNLIGIGDSRTWVLKDPCHLYNLDSLLAVFPDARIICTHRDPYVSFPSVASLIYLLRRIREDNPDPIAHGKLVLDTWGRPLDQFERRRRNHDQRQFFDVHIDEIQADPIGTVERIYRHFGMPITEAARAAWRQRVHIDPKSGHGSHRYAAEQFGLSRAAVYQSCGAYCERYSSVSRNSASK